MQFEDLERESRIHWSELWSPNQSIFKNTVELIKRCIYLPEGDIQYPVIAVYLWLNSRWIRECPLILCKGVPGSGKSNLGKIAAGMHDCPILPSTATFAALRNVINQQRFSGEEGEAELEGAFLVWDNVRSNYFIGGDGSDAKRDCLLNGYKKDLDIVPIAKPGTGEIVAFHTFCPKILTSIDALYSRNELRELKRRLVILFHERLDEEEHGDIELISPDDIDFEGFYSKVFWNFYAGPGWEDRAKIFLEFRKKAKSQRRKKPFDENRKSLCLDLIATGFLIGAWKETYEAYDLLANYWRYLDSVAGDDAGDLEQNIRDWIHLKYEKADSLPHSALQAKIDLLISQAALVARPKSQEVFDAMQRLGWRKQKADWVRER